MRITDEHAAQLRDDGFVVVRGFLSPTEVAAARGHALQYFPTAEELSATPQRYGAIFEDSEHLQVEFPFAPSGDDPDGVGALNHVATHPELIAFVERLLGTPRVVLSQSALWAKYAGAGGDYDQGLHLDYQGNTLVVPRDDGAYRQVNMILYYTDVTDELGPTCVVPQRHTRDLPLWPTHRPRQRHAPLYRHEQQVLAHAGDLLVFSMRTWHRASNIEADFGARFSHHFDWRAAQHNFAGYHLWSRMGENPDLQRFVERATPRQREALGFPPPGHQYWNEETLAAVALRYPKMDVEPYGRPHSG